MILFLVDDVNDYSPLSLPGGSIHVSAFNGVYDFGGSCGVGRTRRSSVTLD